MRNLLIIIGITLLVMSNVLCVRDGTERNNKADDERNVMLSIELYIVSGNITKISFPMIWIEGLSNDEISDELSFIKGSGSIELKTLKEEKIIIIESKSSSFKIGCECKSNHRFGFSSITSVNISEIEIHLEGYPNTIASIAFFYGNTNYQMSGISYYSNPEYQTISNGLNFLQIQSDAWDV